MAESAAPNAELAEIDQIVEGIPVSWTDPEGNPATGVVVGIGGLDQDPPTVSVAPDSDPAAVIDLPVADLEVAGGDPESDDEADPADEAEDVQPKFDVVEGHPDCSDDEGGPVAVIIYADGNEEGEGQVDSCWPDTDAAQAHIENMLNPEADDAPEGDDAAPEFPFAADDETSAPAPIFVGERVLDEKPAEAASGMSELERAALLAAQVRETLDLLHAISPEIDGDPKASFGLDVPVEGETWRVDPTPAAEAAAETAPLPTEEPAVADNENTDELAAETNEVEDLVAEVHERIEEAAVEEPVEAETALADLTEEDLLAELARRYAESKAAEIAALADAPAPVDEPVAVEAAAEEPVVTAAEETVEAAEAPADEPVADEPAEEEPEAEASGEFDWEGVLIVEGLPSGDGRMIAPEALTWRELPIPLMLQQVKATGHDGAIICGSIHAIERDGQNILGYGKFDSGAAGVEAARLLSEGTMRGVSADIDSVVVEFLSEDGSAVSIEDVMSGAVEAMEVLVEGRIMGATLTPFPAFQEAHVKVISSDTPDEAMVAAGGEFRGDVWRVPSPIGVWVAGSEPASKVASGALAALTASAAEAELVDVPANPPEAWFGIGEMEAPVPFTVFPDGRCYGLVAQFGSCHIGFQDRCVDVPRTASAYKHFRNKSVKTAEGSLIATGPIFMDTVHPNLRLVASDAQAHYAHTGCAVADVALYENEFGIVAAGALRPGLTEAQVRTFRGSDVSPDWRKIGGSLEVVGLLSVNVSGFVVEGLVASAAPVSTMARGRFDTVSNEVTALVAAGMVRHEDFEADRMAATDEALADLTGQVTEMRAALEELVLAPARARRAAEIRAAFGIPSDDEARKEKVAALFEVFDIEAPVEEEVTVEAGFRSAEENGELAEEFLAGEAEASVEIVSEDGSIEVVATGDEAVAEVLEALSVEGDCGGSCGAEDGACSCEH